MNVVTKDDCRGRGKKCFYCTATLGNPHDADCVCFTRLVRLKAVIEYEKEVPNCWTKRDIEFHANEGTWCATNIIKDLQEYAERGADTDDLDGTRCICEDVKITYLGEANEEED